MTKFILTNSFLMDKTIFRPGNAITREKSVSEDREREIAETAGLETTFRCVPTHCNACDYISHIVSTCKATINNRDKIDSITCSVVVKTVFRSRDQDLDKMNSSALES